LLVLEAREVKGIYSSCKGRIEPYKQATVSQDSLGYTYGSRNRVKDSRYIRGVPDRGPRLDRK